MILTKPGSIVSLSVPDHGELAPSEAQVLDTYPQIAPDALGEALRFAARSLHGDSVWDVKVTA